MANLARPYNWLIFRIIDPALAGACAQFAHGILLDMGCGQKPYAEMVAPYVDTHLGLDHPGSYHQKDWVNIYATAYDAGLSDQCVDTVLCTDVLEHLEEPSGAINEAFRVLRPGGYAIYTVPLYWHLHEEPRDFYRYTQHGLQYLFEKNGFEIVEIRPLTGFIVTFSQQLCYYLWRWRKGGMINPLWWLIPIPVTLIQALALFLNRFDRSHQFNCEYLIIAKKPETK